MWSSFVSIYRKEFLHIFRDRATLVMAFSIPVFQLILFGFIDQTVPQAVYLDLEVPDPDLKWNAEREHYDFGAIDWTEFYEVIKGNGPCNRERLATRVKAWEDGAWVREAAMAHADKQAARAAKAA